MNLRPKRKEIKMTQYEVAQILGITQVAYGNYENGKRQPKPEMLKKIARLFGCSVDELLENGEPNDKPRKRRTRKKVEKTA